MRLDIFPTKSRHGVKPSFCFGLMEGIMLLAMSRDSVALLREERPKDYRDSDSDDLSDDEGVITGYSDFGGPPGSDPFYTPQILPQQTPKIKQETPSQKRSLGEISDPYGVLAARQKRQKITETTSATVPPSPPPPPSLLQYVSKEVEGYPEEGDEKENMGYLDFDELGLSVDGAFAYPCFFGKQKQRISIYKLSETPNQKHEPGDWYIYDERA